MSTIQLTKYPDNIPRRILKARMCIHMKRMKERSNRDEISPHHNRRRPRVRTPLDLLRKEKNKMLYQAESHSPGICMLSYMYMVVGTVWWDCSKEMSSFINCFAIGLYLVLIGCGTFWYSNAEIKKQIPEKSNSKSVIMTLTMSILSLICLEIMFITEFVAWCKFQTVPNYQLNTFFIDNDIVRNSMTWIILLILSVFSQGYLMYIAIKLLRIELQIYSVQLKIRAENKLKRLNQEIINDLDNFNVHLSNKQEDKSLKNILNDFLNKIKSLFNKASAQNCKEKELESSNSEYSII